MSISFDSWSQYVKWISGTLFVEMDAGKFTRQRSPNEPALQTNWDWSEPNAAQEKACVEASKNNPYWFDAFSRHDLTNSDVVISNDIIHHIFISDEQDQPALDVTVGELPLNENICDTVIARWEHHSRVQNSGTESKVISAWGRLQWTRFGNRLNNADEDARVDRRSSLWWLADFSDVLQ